MNLHNLKAQLGEYKSQYRKYLKAKEIHERMLKVLEKAISARPDSLTVTVMVREHLSGTAAALRPKLTTMTVVPGSPVL